MIEQPLNIFYNPAFYVIILIIILSLICFTWNKVKEAFEYSIKFNNKKYFIKKNTLHFFCIHNGYCIFKAKTFFNKTVYLKKIKKSDKNKIPIFELIDIKEINKKEK